ncbi:hypothetical protein KJ762_07415 [bacterium]|nr:hypothetical protein [bacterium]MBU1064953.1 hypothetical protein [bacterium]MBU1634323.1 hypothetical protein [bacterium]MBU1874575.1 hypothetical protein [bacterium]
MEEIETIISKWQSEKLNKIEKGSVYSRNPIAHKWKAPYRSLVTRELVFWRIIDLIDQTVLLAKNDYILGARILLRSAIETLGILIYLNQKMKALLDGSIKYEDFDSITVRLILGTKQSDSKVESINIVTVLQKCDKKYPGIFDIYKDLSESSHPNFEGMSMGYSEIDDEKYITHFRNRWKELYSNDLEHLTLTCISTFELEYNNVWPELFESLEKWLEKNDKYLSTKTSNT